ncbi:MAG: glutaredoxin family protein [Burkholderiales bacterium]|nr:glutaredoxin family protein [Burkholderiales bacterium]
MAIHRADPVRLTVYSRNYCHLCDEMIAGLRLLQAGFHFELDIIDVDSRPELEQRYGDKVPLLAHDATEICHYRLEPAVFSEYLAKIC